MISVFATVHTVGLFSDLGADIRCKVRGNARWTGLKGDREKYNSVVDKPQTDSDGASVGVQEAENLCSEMPVAYDSIIRFQASLSEIRVRLNLMA
ncbi:hypothetical protein QCA50_007284 [Cerrena zonata]|uniref:Uncharacterized protein n=1 Tax=Cerrena zonata TaxID=2478898 RepID=A0AAW0GD72_9APHY